MLTKSFTAFSLLSASASAETVLGVYMFHRHGDRTPKALAPANLTDLGYQQVYTSGDYYRNRYIASDSEHKILGINTDIVKQSQLSASAPSDTVLQNSASGFLQGLYPPVGEGIGTQTLRNGTHVTVPLNGYQLIPLQVVSGGSGSEDKAWLQSASGCASAVSSSNEYFSSNQYTTLLDSTRDFYSSLAPVINGTFSASQMSYKNAYTIYDLINAAEIHNASINAIDVLTPEVLFQLRTLADSHEWNLAYNSTNDMRAMAGKVLAAEIVSTLNKTIESSGQTNKFNLQFGAYAAFLSFFGLAGLPEVDGDFYGLADFASSMAFELVSNISASSPSAFPETKDISVRFLFHNGTASAASVAQPYALFGSGKELIAWDDFVAEMSGFSVDGGSAEAWCTACGNSTGSCSSASAQHASAAGNASSPVVNGVIGALVTLAVVLCLQAAVLVLGGFRVVGKKSLLADASSSSSSSSSSSFSTTSETVMAGKVA